MPLTVPDELSEHLLGELTTLCTLWEITRKDGTVYRFTDHDTDVEFAGNVYAAGIGYDRSAIEDKSDMSADNMNVKGILDTTFISRRDIRAGLFDGAEVIIRVINWAAPEQGSFIRRRGWLGEVRQNNLGQFDTELRGLSEALSETLGRVYSPGCVVDLGSQGAAKCNLVLDGSWTQDVTVRASPAPNRQTFSVTVTEPRLATDPTFYNGGLIVCNYGANAGLSQEMKTVTGYNGVSALVTLYLRWPFDVEPGDDFTMYPGCDKSLGTCRDRFANTINYQGFPHVPGDDYLRNYPDPK